jgi:ankyrin repeat protein
MKYFLKQWNVFFLIIASERGHVDIVEYLLVQGSNVNEKNNKGETSLHLRSQMLNF